MKQSLLWKMEREDAHVSYLFGTMHVKSKRVFSRIEQLKQLIEKSDVFAAEYHLDEIRSEQNGSDMFLPNSISISELLGAKKFARIRTSLLKSFSIDIYQYDRVLPLLLVNVIGEAILSKEYHLPLDVYLWEYAKEQEKKLIGIESYESQKWILKKMQVKDQLKMLKDLSRNTAKYRRNIIKMAEWYEMEQIQKLYKNGKSSLGKYKSILLHRRNLVMADRFEEIANEYSVVFAVGAGHLAGSQGLLRLLKNKGWKIKAI